MGAGSLYHRFIPEDGNGEGLCSLGLGSGTQKVYLIVPTGEGYPLSGITRNSPVQFLEANAEKRGLFVEQTLTNFPFGADLDIEKTRSHRNPMHNCARRRHRVGLKI